MIIKVEKTDKGRFLILSSDSRTKKFKLKELGDFDSAHIISHGIDPDGWSSAAILDMVLGNIPKYHFRHDYSYNHKKLLEKIPAKSTVFVADLSLPHDVFDTLVESSETVFWFDHHETAVKNCKNTKFEKLLGRRVIEGAAACELVWDFFIDEPIPPALNLISKFDIRDKAFIPDIDIFNIYVRQNAKLPYDVGWLEYWGEMFLMTEEDVENIKEVVRPIYNYSRDTDEMVSKSIAFTTPFMGYSAIVANRSNVGVSFFDAVVKPDHDFMINYYRLKNGNFKYTIFTKKEDRHAGELAERLVQDYGVLTGGGHAGCGGFVTDIDFDSLIVLIHLINEVRNGSLTVSTMDGKDCKTLSGKELKNLLSSLKLF